MEKNPISILQEYAVAKGLPFPSYHIVNEGDLYKCTVIVGSITKDAQAANKKNAKRLAAEKLLSSLVEGANASGYLLSNGNTTKQSNAESGETANSVGQLNEFCSGKRKDYPTYEFNAAQDGEFICQCKLDAQTTRGKGKSKKDAKQVAAKCMLKVLESSPYTIETNLTTSSSDEVDKGESIRDDNIIDLFKKYSFRTRISSDRHAELLPSQKKLTPAEIALYFQEAQDKESLQTLLANLEVIYTISVFQEQPLIMCIRTEAGNYPEFTFLRDGTDVNRVKVKLLKDVVSAVAVHYLK